MIDNGIVKRNAMYIRSCKLMNQTNLAEAKKKAASVMSTDLPLSSIFIISTIGTR